MELSRENNIDKKMLFPFLVAVVLLMLSSVVAGVEIDVVGARKANKTDAPWIVSLQMYEDDYAYCSAALIGSKSIAGKDKECEGWIITAASCLEGVPQEKIATLANLNLFDDSEGDEDDGIPLVLGLEHKHENYNRSRHEHDIALIKVNFTLNANWTESLCKPPPNTKECCEHFPTLQILDEKTNNDGIMLNATFAGWGLQNEIGKLQTTLLNTTLDLWTDRECGDLYRSTNKYFNSSTMFCAGSKNDTKSACSYDVGGPLACEYEVEGKKEKRLCGIAVSGYGCGTNGFDSRKYPTIFTDVIKFADWINRITTTTETGSSKTYDLMEY